MSTEPGQRLVKSAPPPTTRTEPPPPAPASGGRAVCPTSCDAAVEAATLARQLQSIIEHCDRARFGLVRTSEIYRLIITDPADQEPPR